MNILHWLKSEDSGLMRSALEVAHFEERLGHSVCIKQPSEADTPIYGVNGKVDVHCIHSQLAPEVFHDGVPKIMWMHGEPLSSVANGISMKAIIELAPLMDAFICMRREEQHVWNQIRRTWYVPKGCDLEMYKPQEPKQKLSGEPAVLYCENWRGDRNPLYLVAAMPLVKRRHPGARLHLYNCKDSRMFKTFKALWEHTKAGVYWRSISGPSQDVVDLYNSSDVVASCLYPLYARTAVESLACGKPFVGPGYREPGYPYHCDLSPESIADAICKAWEMRDTFDARLWAVDHHSAEEMTRQAITVYERYL